jgi:hypothetical protein
MDVKHKSKTPVFIIGHGRSGTSITANLFTKYLKISFGTESQFIVRYYKKLNKYGDLNVDENLKRLISDLTHERWFERSKKFGMVADVDAIFNGLTERSYRGILESIFMQLARLNHMQRWGDKTPEYVYHLPVLKALFPGARYIHIVRDGRDVALSLFQMHFGSKNIYKAAKEWKDVILMVKDFAAQSLDKEQFMEFRYEDLLVKPAQIFAQIIDFLELDDTDGKLIDFISANIPNDLKAGNFNKWKGSLSQSDQELFEKAACDVLADYGYETTIEDVQSFSPIHRVYWNIDNQIKKWKTPGYWEDNVYRVKLRIKDMIPFRGVHR